MKNETSNTPKTAIKNMASNLLLPAVFSCVGDALNALAEAEYDCKSKYGRQVNLIYDWGCDAWWVKLKGLRDDLGCYETQLEACQKMYDYLVVLGVRKYSR